MDRAANDKAERYRERSRKKMLIAVFAAARPVELSSIQFVRADDDQVAPHHAQETSNQFPASDNTNNAIYSDEKTRHTQEHGDNGAGIDQSITGSYGLVRRGKFVDLRALLATMARSPLVLRRAIHLPA